MPADENCMSRIYGGVHWMRGSYGPDEAGKRLPIIAMTIFRPEGLNDDARYSRALCFSGCLRGAALAAESCDARMSVSNI